ncbi:tRNA preQ1(34) S-adenosylmethionine ribosyltransferase-isomerase QueA [bacterium]|nr:tRNA preQ1(34) S-adenosylmethionine ribosyltransferase-isomerase QueA [bacterium]
MRTEEFDYYLPPEQIAQEPVVPRDHSKLLVVDRKNQIIEHKKFFYEIVDYLSSKDVLVFNDTKVVPARIRGKKISTGGKVELLLLRPKGASFIDFQQWPKRWVAIGKPELREGTEIEFGQGLRCRVKERKNYERVIEFNEQGEELKEHLLQIGEVPLPPYIKNPTDLSFRNYQTIYANKEGSVAAPTAGFHFTPELLKRIKELGVQIEYITLHIGLGTFLPVKTENIEDHQMHSEFFIIDKKTAESINKAKKEGKRIIAVGTTVVRALESSSTEDGYLLPGQNWTTLFIYPGYKFKIVDSLITNFHLPRSTLLMLVCAFAGKKLIFRAYQEALRKKYRFFSFGDAMFIR